MGYMAAALGVSGRLSTALRLLGIISVVSTAAACRAGDYEFYIKNESDSKFVVRVPLLGVEGRYRAANVTSHTEGQAFWWAGAKNLPIELLTPDCEVIGVFMPDPDGVYRIPGVSGVSGLVAPSGTYPQKEDLEIHGTVDCGGVVHL